MSHVHVHVHRVPTQLRRLLRKGDECTPERDAHLAPLEALLAGGKATAEALLNLTLSTRLVLRGWLSSWLSD